MHKCHYNARSISGRGGSERRGVTTTPVVASSRPINNGFIPAAIVFIMMLIKPKKSNFTHIVYFNYQQTFKNFTRDA